MGRVQYRGEYHEYRGGYLEYRGGYHDARGGYHEYRVGGVQYCGFVVLSSAKVLKTLSYDNSEWIMRSTANLKQKQSLILG